MEEGEELSLSSSRLVKLVRFKVPRTEVLMRRRRRGVWVSTAGFSMSGSVL